MLRHTETSGPSLGASSVVWPAAPRAILRRAEAELGVGARRLFGRRAQLKLNPQRRARSVAVIEMRNGTLR